MTFRVIAKRDPAFSWDQPGAWKLAPWNEGNGGKYKALTDVSASDVGCELPLDSSFVDDFLEFLSFLEPPISKTDVTTMLLALDDGCRINYAPLGSGVVYKVDNETVRIVPSDDRDAKKNKDAGTRIPIGKQSWVDRLTSSASKSDIFAIASDSTDPRVCWILEGGRSAWQREMEQKDNEQAERKIKKDARLQRREIDDTREARDSFVNPYTFVPLPRTISRSKPRGHASLSGDGLSGSFDWTLTLVTPLLLPSDNPGVPLDCVLRYPGSALRGALRSLHETLAGGCMRVLDDTYLPVHRETMNALKRGDRLVVVTKIDEFTDRVIEVRETGQTVWIKLQALQNLKRLYSGMKVDIDLDGQIESSTKKRKEIRSSEYISEGKEWVLHFTESTSERDKHNYYVAAGKLTNNLIRFDSDNWRHPNTWDEYVRDCEGSKDLRGEGTSVPSTADYQPNTQHWPSRDVEHWSRTHLKPRRRKVDGWLSEGDTVWLTADGRFKMSAIWRKTGTVSVEERLPDSDTAPTSSHLPCSDPSNLCPSCAVFGSVSVQRSGDNEQAGYASHVKVGWGSITTTEPVDDVTIAPLRNPKPSSGGFYLETPPGANLSASKDENHIPRSHWGSDLDKKAPRKIRGRKQYWHGQVDSPNPRQIARKHQQEDGQAGARQAVHTGATVTSHVTFENLSPEQLGWLLAAANPAAFFTCIDGEKTPCQIHIGGGKPLGYGSAIPMIENFELFNARQRYGVSKKSSLDCEALDEKCKTLWGLCKQRIDERGLEFTHRALRKVLQPKAVHADRIWYPTTKKFLPNPTPGAMKDFDKSFEWFGSHSGGRKKTYKPGKKGPNGKLVPLPDVLNPNQYLRSWEDQ